VINSKNQKSEESETILISEEESGERLDKILAQRYKEVQSRTYFQYLIEEKCVLLNGFPVKKRVKPKVDDEVEIFFLITPEIDVTPEPIPLDILYEDEHILVVNKPAGMVVHPAPGNWSGTFVNALLHHCKELPGKEGTRPGIVHRLDKNTSGVLVAVKSHLAQQKLIEMFSGREVYKEYAAICLGNPGETTIDQPIGRHPVHRQKMTVIEGGRNAITHCQTLAFDGKLSLVKINLETGRTHQIRVHMKHHGTPVLGDPTYGNPQANKTYDTSRQMLHAKILRFKHPITAKDVEFQAEIPHDMMAFINRISK